MSGRALDLRSRDRWFDMTEKWLASTDKQTDLECYDVVLLMCFLCSWRIYCLSEHNILAQISGMKLENYLSACMLHCMAYSLLDMRVRVIIV